MKIINVCGLVVALAGCEKPPQRPQPTPADAGGITGCRSSPTAGGRLYMCNHFGVYNGTIEAASIDEVEAQLMVHARGKDVQPSSQTRTITGAAASAIIEYRKDGRHSFDLLATNPADAKLRVVQCHVPWFEDAASQPSREDACLRVIDTLLHRPAPPVYELSAQCKQATMRLETLQGHPDDPDELNAALRDFSARCTDSTAACVLASTSYVEANLCGD